jgi:hypothetical protein
MYMYVYILYVYVCLYVYRFMSVCLSVSLHVCMFVRMYVCMYICMNSICIHMYVCWTALRVCLESRHKHNRIDRHPYQEWGRREMRVRPIVGQCVSLPWATESTWPTPASNPSWVGSYTPLRPTCLPPQTQVTRLRQATLTSSTAWHLVHCWI